LVLAPDSHTRITGSIEKARTLTIAEVELNYVVEDSKKKKGDLFLSEILMFLMVSFIG
jgi:hypothetical protein